MAAVEVLSIPEIAAKVVAFTAKALLVCPAAARHHPLVLSAYERSVLKNRIVVRQKVDRRLLLCGYEQKQMIASIRVTEFGRVEDERFQLPTEHPAIKAGVAFMEALLARYCSGEIQKRNINPTKQQMLTRLRKAGGLMKRPSAAKESDVEDLGGDAAADKNDGEATLEPAHGRKNPSKDGDVNDAVDEEKKEVKAKTTKLKTTPLKTKKVKPTLTKKKLKTTKLKTKPLKTKKVKPTLTKKISRPMKTGSLSKLAADAKRASKDGDVNDAVDEDKEEVKAKTTKLKTKPLKTKKVKPTLTKKKLKTKPLKTKKVKLFLR